MENIVKRFMWAAITSVAFCSTVSVSAGFLDMLKSACGINEPAGRRSTKQFRDVAATTPDVAENLLGPRSSPPPLTDDMFRSRSSSKKLGEGPVVVDMPELDDAITRRLIADMRARDR